MFVFYHYHNSRRLLHPSGAWRSARTYVHLQFQVRAQPKVTHLTSFFYASAFRSSGINHCSTASILCLLPLHAARTALPRERHSYSTASTVCGRYLHVIKAPPPPVILCLALITLLFTRGNEACSTVPNRRPSRASVSCQLTLPTARPSRATPSNA